MPRYVVTLRTISYEVIDAKDDDAALRRAVAAAKNGRESSNITAIKAERA